MWLGLCNLLAMSLTLKQIANWTEESDKLEQISFIRWCSQQELSSLPLCHKGNSFRCNIKSPPLKAPDDSNYQYDYSRYSFDVVTLEVALAIRDPYCYNILHVRRKTHLSK